MKPKKTPKVKWCLANEIPEGSTVNNETEKELEIIKTMFANECTDYIRDSDAETSFKINFTKVHSNAKLILSVILPKKYPNVVANIDIKEKCGMDDTRVTEINANIKNYRSECKSTKLKLFETIIGINTIFQSIPEIINSPIEKPREDSDKQLKIEIDPYHFTNKSPNIKADINSTDADINFQLPTIIRKVSEGTSRY